MLREHVILSQWTYIVLRIMANLCQVKQILIVVAILNLIAQWQRKWERNLNVSPADPMFANLNDVLLFLQYVSASHCLCHVAFSGSRGCFDTGLSNHDWVLIIYFKTSNDVWLKLFVIVKRQILFCSVSYYRSFQILQVFWLCQGNIWINGAGTTTKNDVQVCLRMSSKLKYSILVGLFCSCSHYCSAYAKKKQRQRKKIHCLVSISLD